VERSELPVVDRKQVAAVMASLRQEMSARLGSGLLPYDGRWVTPAEVEQGILQERRRARVHAIELILLYCASSFVSLILVALTWVLCY
jgi:hypothetical protein